MKKGLKIAIIVIVSIVAISIIVGAIAYFSTGKSANADEYKLGDDTIKSVKAIVEKREVTGVSTATENGVKTKKITYKSETVQDDLIKYVQYLRNEGGFTLTKDMNLAQMPGTVQLGKESKDEGKLIMMTIDYDTFEYTVTIQKGKGTLTRY